MAYLIDGNNLTGYLFAPFLYDYQSREKVVELLLIFQRIKRTKVTVVFDGPPQPELEEVAQAQPKFEIIFPPPGEKADTIIIELLRQRSNKRNFWVVSSDREIRHWAHQLGFKSLTAAEFAKELKVTSKRHQRHLEYQKNAQLPTPLEIKHWSELFGKKPK